MGGNLVVDKNSEDGTGMLSQVTPDTTTVPTNNTEYTTVACFLESKDFKEEAMAVTTDPNH
eukprot:10508891-Ditylum_brightwellii.AAC.1